MARRLGIVLLCLCVASAGVAAASSASKRPTRAAATAQCGTERWAVKTLTDPDASKVNMRSHTSTVDTLRALPKPHVSMHTPRMAGTEHQTFRIDALLVAMKLEADSDIHVEIADPKHPSHTMIAEFPDSGCTHGASASARRKMSATRRALVLACGNPGTTKFRRLGGEATLTGVGFFDVIHGQRGVAPNGIELHPVLGFKATSC
jgi:hypothetical protein